VIDKKLSAYFAQMGRKSAKARMKNLSPEERQRIARKAAKARWAKAKGRKKLKSRAGRKP
jgi:flagellar motor switch protein FliG